MQSSILQDTSALLVASRSTYVSFLCASKCSESSIGPWFATAAGCWFNRTMSDMIIQPLALRSARGQGSRHTSLCPQLPSSTPHALNSF
mmetsp:Transcript_18322/g.43859  ORF Transcript_18322/g.43859 Transcript_18322/m.43859 type:complete len:89 (+) Transcript_18322:92-358(+)